MEADSNYLPEIVKPEVKEKTVEVDLSKFGLPTIVLKKRSNFSDYVGLATQDAKTDLLAKSFTSRFGCYVDPMTVEFAGQIAAMYQSPMIKKEDGTVVKPNRDYFVKLSIQHAEAFSEIVAALNGVELADDVEELVEKAVMDFPERAQAMSG